MSLRSRTLPLPYVRIFVLRAVIVWIGLHIPSFALTGSMTHTSRAAVLALTFTILVILLDAERRNERRFLSNLGASRLAIAIVVMVTAVVLELLLRLVPESLLDGLRLIGGS